MKSTESQTRRDQEPTRFSATSGMANIDPWTVQVHEVASLNSLARSRSLPTSIPTTTSSSPTLVYDRLSSKHRANIANWIATTPGYETIEGDDLEKSSYNSSDETLVNEDLGPIHLEAIPPFPRPNLTGSSLYGLHNQLLHPRMSSFTELIEEDLIDPRLVPVVADSDSDVNNSLRPFCHNPTLTASWASSPEPEYPIVLIVQFVSKKARSVATRGAHICRVLRKKLSRDRELDE
ncbi:hypothetical protein N7467_003241 [Penicillium canescens]|nr:hypothetical protein N7467_003241 [Penicillium canescens]